MDGLDAEETDFGEMRKWANSFRQTAEELIADDQSRLGYLESRSSFS